MEYEGMRVEVVASGMRGGTAGSSGSTTAAAATGAAATGAGAAGAAAGFLDFLVFFFVFLPPMQAPPPTQQQSKAKRTIHCQICNWDPKEPEAVDPELAEPEMSLALEPVLKESPELEEPAGPKPSEFSELED